MLIIAATCDMPGEPNVGIGCEARGPTSTSTYMLFFFFFNSCVHLLDIFSNTMCSVMELVINLGENSPIFLLLLRTYHTSSIFVGIAWTVCSIFMPSTLNSAPCLSQTTRELQFRVDHTASHLISNFCLPSFSRLAFVGYFLS